MATEEQVRGSLQEVLVPAVKRSIVGLNLVREVAVRDETVKVSLASTGLVMGAQDYTAFDSRYKHFLQTSQPLLPLPAVALVLRACQPEA